MAAKQHTTPREPLFPKVSVKDLEPASKNYSSASGLTNPQADRMTPTIPTVPPAPDSPNRSRTN